MTGGVLLVPALFGLLAPAASGLLVPPALLLTVRFLVLPQVATLLAQLSFPPVSRHRARTPAEPRPLTRIRQLLSVTKVPGARRP
jgi:hypothetical protein